MDSGDISWGYPATATDDPGAGRNPFWHQVTELWCPRNYPPLTARLVENIPVIRIDDDGFERQDRNLFNASGRQVNIHAVGPDREDGR